ncbi:cytochrome P450 2U1-like [Liolophura sinensis]|uniref:cytochrome P450 2U1-like n=1 Tax=Liolophura sinensis TaxID=3198878 RepID=UPI003158165A
MIDFLLRHQEELRVETGSSWLDDDSIKAIIQEMVGAGSITTRGALYSFFLIIVHKPEVARRIQDEIEAVVGSCRFPCLEDRPNMPYTVAVVFELLRYISHVPIGVPRVTTTDVTFRGYIIPEKTKVMANIWLIHHDDKIWDDPWEFKPQRFLNEEGNLLSADHPNRKNLLPFGIGRRSCVGEAFAKSRMFLFITTLLQRFHFTRDPTKPLPSCDPRTYTGGLVFSPYPYYVTVTKRE